MKTFSLPILLALGASLLLLSARAAEPASASTIRDQSALEHAVLHQIDRHVVFPLYGDEESLYGTVVVDIAVDVNGHLVVQAAESENEALRAYVVRKLRKVHVGPNPTGLWYTTHLRFTFRPEQSAL